MTEQFTHQGGHPMTDNTEIFFKS